MLPKLDYVVLRFQQAKRGAPGVLLHSNVFNFLLRCWDDLRPNKKTQFLQWDLQPPRGHASSWSCPDILKGEVHPDQRPGSPQMPPFSTIKNQVEDAVLYLLHLFPPWRGDCYCEDFVCWFPHAGQPMPGDLRAEGLYIWDCDQQYWCTLTAVAERRTLDKLLSVINNDSRPLHSTTIKQRRRLLSQNCPTIDLRNHLFQEPSDSNASLGWW